MNAWIEADWPAPAGVRAITTLRHGLGISQPPFDRFNLGLRSGDAGEAVIANRTALADALQLPSPPCWLRQVHGTAVVRDPHLDDEPEADAAVTDRPGTVLAILTADCLPVVLAARDGTEIAVAHAGWRGLAAGVLEATVSAMRTPADRLQAWLGPCAGPDAYEIGADVHTAFVTGDPQAETAFVATRPGHWRVNLPLLARQRLAAAGIAPQAIHGGDACTITDAVRFFSHRRSALRDGGHTGRMATLAWIEPR